VSKETELHVFTLQGACKLVVFRRGSGPSGKKFIILKRIFCHVALFEPFSGHGFIRSRGFTIILI
jgi:hypothetical protein